MAATPIKGNGTSLYGQFDGTNYVKVTDVVSIDGPAASVATSDITSLDSSAVERISTIADFGSLSGSMIYDPQETTHDNLTTLLTSPSTVAWKLTFADSSSSTFEFSGILTSFEVGGMESDAHVTADFEISLTGLVDFSGTSE